MLHGEPVSEEEVESVEQKLGVSLPPDYREFVLRYGYGEASHFCIYSIGIWDFVEQTSNLKHLLPEGYEDMILIGYDGGVNPIWFKPDYPEIYLVEHNSGEVEFSSLIRSIPVLIRLIDERLVMRVTVLSVAQHRVLGIGEALYQAMPKQDRRFYAMDLFEMHMHTYHHGFWRMDSKNDEVMKQIHQYIAQQKQEEETTCPSNNRIKLELSFFEKRVLEHALQLYYFYVGAIRFQDETLIKKQFEQLQRILDTSTKVENLRFKVKEPVFKTIPVDKTKIVSDEDLPF